MSKKEKEKEKEKEKGNFRQTLVLMGADEKVKEMDSNIIFGMI